MERVGRSRTVVYSRGDSRVQLQEPPVLDVKNMAITIGVERPTVMNWTAFGLLITERNERIGPRRVIAYNPEYAAAIAPFVKAAKKKQGGRGGAILTPELEGQIRKINADFYPNRKP